MLCYIFVCRTYYLDVVDDFFEPVSRPAGNTRYSKNRREKLFRYAEHIINESAVKIDVRADRLEKVSLFRYDFFCYVLNSVEKFVLCGAAFFSCEFFRVILEYDLSRV